MKKMIAVAVLFLAGCAPGSMTQLTADEKIIETVLELPGVSKEAVFDSSQKWLAETFQSARVVIESVDRETGTLVGNGTIPYPCEGMACLIRGSWNVPFRLKIEAGNEEVRTTFYEIRISMPPSGDDYSANHTTGGVGPVWRKADMDVIKPALLVFNGRLKTYILDNRQR